MSKEMSINLYPHQLGALRNLKDKQILCGGTGSGKSITAVAYYYLQNGGDIKSLQGGKYKMMQSPMDLYIITTARKRDTFEWNDELVRFLLSTNQEQPSVYKNKVVIDSWNNVQKYIGVRDAFFIFDEQRVVGSGAWVKAFLKISSNNRWILLSATPGDTWTDYIPVFIANGFYRNRTEFLREHVVYSSKCKNFPKIEKYIETQRLMRLRDKVLVQMAFDRDTTQHKLDIRCEYDKEAYRELSKSRWNTYTNKPIENASELCYTWRKIVNSDPDRIKQCKQIAGDRHRVIIFYNFDYELELLRNVDWGSDYEVAEWNGHKHQDIPRGSYWVYLVQYTAGAEGWNCTTTDSMIFYSQNYSYKVMVQSAGRIDRLNTPFKDLYYYHLSSNAPIDVAIQKAIHQKKNFNEGSFISKVGSGANDEKRIAELINRRQRQILVHSVIYYIHNDNIVSDYEWGKWAKELTQLQEKYPDIAKAQPYGDAFVGFDPSTGAFLPLEDPWANEMADRLLAQRDNGGTK